MCFSEFQLQSKSLPIQPSSPLLFHRCQMCVVFWRLSLPHPVSFSLYLRKPFSQQISGMSNSDLLSVFGGPKRTLQLCSFFHLLYLLFHSKQTNKNKRKVINTIKMKYIWRATVSENHLSDCSLENVGRWYPLISCVSSHLVSGDIILLRFSELHFQGQN